MIGGAAQSLRIGCVKYLNAQPLIFGWPNEVVLDDPATLCRKLAAAELDVALVSSFEYLRNPVYAIADGVCIAAEGPVYSVFVAHRGPIEELTEISLDLASQTSVNLLRCLLGERRLTPRVTARADGVAPLGDGRGALLIGDQAIEFRQQNTELSYWDLGAAWREATGLPFVFALWLIRPGVPGASSVASALRDQCERNLRALDVLIGAQARFTAPFCAFYFGDCLRFRFAEREKAGLLQFRALCEQHGILPANATPLRLV